MTQIEKEFRRDALEECHIFFRIRQSVNVIGHYLLFFPYMLRAYRLFIIFQIDIRWEKEENALENYIHRTKSKWMKVLLVIYLLPFVIICIVIMNNCSFAKYMPGYESSNGPGDVSDCVYLFISFLEQLLFIYAIQKIHDISDDYNITKELTICMILWFTTPIMLHFPVDINNPYKPLPFLLRNILLFIASDIYPIYCSIWIKSSQEVMTLEMLESIESIVQSKTALNQFDKYLKEIDCKPNNSKLIVSGSMLLELYMKCEMFLSCPNDYNKDELIQELLWSEVVPMSYFSQSKIDLELHLIDAKSVILERIKNEYFEGFKNSHRYKELKKYVHCQEIYTGRLFEIGMVNTISSLSRYSDSFASK